jgi:hypothetical protein
MSPVEVGQHLDPDGVTGPLRQPRKRRRARTYLGIAFAAAVGVTLVLYGVSRVLASSTDFDWFHLGCGVLALVGFVGTIGAIVWNAVGFVKRRFERRSAARPIFIASMAMFGFVPFLVGTVTHQPPSLRPLDSPAWAGKRTTRNGITQVRATWVQPRVYPLGSRPNDVAFWVGLADPESSDLEQIGTSGDCQRHTPATYDAWYELYPGPVVAIDLAVRPGDRVTATVTRKGESHFALTLFNATTGARFSTVQVVSGVGNSKGAIIVEEPSFISEDLPGFGPVHFTKCAFDGQPIDSFRLTSLDIQSDAGIMETATSLVAAHGTSFTVRRH